MCITHSRFKGNLKLKVKLNVNIARKLYLCARYKIKLYNFTSLFLPPHIPTFFIYNIIDIVIQLHTCG